VLGELAYVYRRADRGAMTWADAGAAARVLREIRFCLESSDFEERLVRLEAAAAGNWRPAANGGAEPHATH
jgi:hypothetical protein